MKVIRDIKRLERYFKELQLHFQQKLKQLKLIQFEKGELLNGPMAPLKSFYIVVEGSVSIYYITEEATRLCMESKVTGTAQVIDTYIDHPELKIATDYHFSELVSRIALREGIYPSVFYLLLIDEFSKLK